jgi:hypothetical protein
VCPYIACSLHARPLHTHDLMICCIVQDPGRSFRVGPTGRVRRMQVPATRCRTTSHARYQNNSSFLVLKNFIWLRIMQDPNNKRDCELPRTPLHTHQRDLLPTYSNCTSWLHGIHYFSVLLTRRRRHMCSFKRDLVQGPSPAAHSTVTVKLYQTFFTPPSNATIPRPTPTRFSALHPRPRCRRFVDPWCRSECVLGARTADRGCPLHSQCSVI